jgi:threonine dehydrogenase-like Zn-dependent dehydrogenase
MMKAAVFEGVEQGIKIKEVERPAVRNPTDVLIRLRACGFCGTDLSILLGRHFVNPPLILGHECAGEIVEIGQLVKSLSRGDHVVVDPVLNCGVCQYCRTGHRNLCPNMDSLGINVSGGFAEYLVAPERCVFKVPHDLDWVEATLVEPLACVIHPFNRLGQVNQVRNAVVFGAGPIGLLWISLLKYYGVRRIFAVDLLRKRLDLARSVGATDVINPVEENVRQKIVGESSGFGAELAIEAIGKPETVESAIRCLAPAGTAVIMGVSKKGTYARFEPLELLADKHILGTVDQVAGFVPAIDAVLSGVIQSSKIITHQLPLDKIAEVIDAAKNGTSIKAVVTID